MNRILLLEDEMQLGQIVAETLEARGYLVTHVSNGQVGLDAFYRSKFDICVVDIMMPFLNGLEFVKQVRKVDSAIPILFLSAKDQSKDIVNGYSVGGNDYLRKPFSLEELLLRINELLKRTSISISSSSNVKPIGSILFNSERQELTRSENEVIKLSYKESQLLDLLVIYKNKVIERKMILLQIWGDDHAYNSRTMDVFITKLRKHLQIDSKIEILNVRGIGFKLICNES